MAEHGSRNVSYTRAKSLQGALVQLAISLDELDSLISPSTTKNEQALLELNMGRLIRSAMRAMFESIGSEIDPEVTTLAAIYGAGPNANLWIDRVESWAEKHPRAGNGNAGNSIDSNPT